MKKTYRIKNVTTKVILTPPAPLQTYKLVGGADEAGIRETISRSGNCLLPGQEITVELDERDAYLMAVPGDMAIVEVSR